jgi:hypothetical protein
MRNFKLLILLLFVISLSSCKKSNAANYNYDNSVDSTIEDNYPDGTYCANIDYYNPDTGTRNTYTLNVEVESHEVTVIQWSNGGWLDSSHFSPEELDSSGSCSFTTFDGKQYDVQITGPECSYTDESKVSNDSYYERQQETCPECGFEKETYEELCYNCKRKQENIEEHTCKSCGQYDTFMWSSDDLCSDCKRKQEE